LAIQAGFTVLAVDTARTPREPATATGDALLLAEIVRRLACGACNAR